MWVAVWVALLPILAAMRVDPERIAARLRIEGEIENDRLARSGRPRRQLQPKEISIQVTAPLFSSRLFEYGKDAGDSEIPPALDVGKIVKLTNPMNFFGKDYHTIYVLSNGAIGFDSSSRSYKADVLGSAARLIAPFWNRNDLRNGGRVYYREVTKGRVLERGQSEIRYQYDKHVKVTSALVVTWEQMQPLGAAPLPEENTNTFQCALFVTANGTFANFIYSNIGWTQGAEAGFYSGDNKKFYSLPTSGTGNIMYLEEYGNTGIPGEWMFEMQKDSILRCKMGIKGDTCDEECSKGEWGADCASCCHCGQGTCHPLTGECPRGCASCWTGTNCQQKTESCHARSSVKCAANAVAFTDYDRCGEPVPRCGCLEGFTGDGFKKCVDIDECQNSTACHSEAICTNTPGRFFCQCKEGFSGDGKNECVATFLYASVGHQELPKSKNAKVAWQLKNPLKILGELRDQLVITTSGLISLADVTVSSSQLDEIQMTGIAPFFAPIDTTRSGHVTVAEVTDSETLTRVTRMVADQFGDPSFLAKSVLIVTYMNVTNGSSQRDNTLQSVLIGGTNDAGDDRTYVQLLYKQMSWGNGAEAGIMTNDVSTSLSLPGSGNEGIEQLPHLSNIKQPGIWMYRIDEPSIMPCPLKSQQPPYCDVEKPQTEQHAVVPEPKTPVLNVEANLDKKSEEMRIQKVPVGAPRFITPVLEEPPSRTPVRQSTTNIPVTAAPIAPERKETTRTTRPRPQFESTPHRPLVSLGKEDFEIEPDVFAPIDEDIGTFAPFVTVVPEVFVPESKKATRKQLPDFTIPQAVPVSSTSSTVQPTFPTFQLENQTEAVETLQQEIESEESSEDEGVLLPEEPIQSIERTSENQSVPETTTDSTTEEMEMTETMEDEDSELPSTTERTTTPRKEFPAKPIFIFSTTPRSKPTTRATSARTKPVILTAPPTVDETEKTPESDAAHASKLAIIIPTGIVAVWVVLLVVIALVVCCRRRNSEAQLRAMYGPTYGVRPTGYALKRGSKNLEGSYEDHLEKAARISNEMTAYNQSGRVSLYGSYWNLNNSSSSPGSGPSSRQSPPFNGYAPTRYPYAGRY